MGIRRKAMALAVLAALILSGCVSDGSQDSASPTNAAPSSSTSTDPTPTVPDPPLVVAVDSGAIEHALGAAVEVSAGEYEYVVEPGDTPEAIGVRFGLCTLDVLLSNPPQDPWLVPGQSIRVERVVTEPIGTQDCRFDVDQGPHRG